MRRLWSRLRGRFPDHEARSTSTAIPIRSTRKLICTLCLIFPIDDIPVEALLSSRFATLGEVNPWNLSIDDITAGIKAKRGGGFGRSIKAAARDVESRDDLMALLSGTRNGLDGGQTIGDLAKNGLAGSSVKVLRARLLIHELPGDAHRGRAERIPSLASRIRPRRSWSMGSRN